MSTAGDIAAWGSCLAAFSIMFIILKNKIVQFYGCLMLRFFPNHYIRTLVQRVHKKTSVEDLEKLALCLCGNQREIGCLERLDGHTCYLAETALNSCNPDAPLFETPDILKMAAVLSSIHPGWRLLSLMVEHTGRGGVLQQGNEEVLAARIPSAVANLGEIKNRLVKNEFTTMRPFAIVVWVECRLKIHIEASDDTTFPAEWKDIMKTDVLSPELISSRHLKGLLSGSVDMVFSQQDLQ